jgi:hypothetical protein
LRNHRKYTLSSNPPKTLERLSDDCESPDLDRSVARGVGGMGLPLPRGNIDACDRDGDRPNVNGDVIDTGDGTVGPDNKDDAPAVLSTICGMAKRYSGIK